METLLVAKRDLVIARVLDRLADRRITTELAAWEPGMPLKLYPLATQDARCGNCPRSEGGEHGAQSRAGARV
jgi:hypothetical protein